MTSSSGAPGRHAAPFPVDEGYDDWLSAPAHAEPPSGLPGGFGHVRSAAVRAGDWVTAPAFDDAFLAYTSQTGSRPAPAHAAAPVIVQEPDPWPTVTFTEGDPPAWETPHERHPARSHRRESEPRAGRAVRSHPVAFGLVGLLAGLALSLVVLKVVSVAFPSLLPAL